MPEGQAQATGAAEQTFEFEGKTWTLSAPFRVGTYREMEAYVIALRDDVLAVATEACKTAPSEMHETIWAAALSKARQSRIVTQDEMRDFELSMHGWAWKLWYCLKQHHAEEMKSPDDALDMLERAAEAECLREIQSKINLASGEDDLGNLSGQPRQEEDLTELATDPAVAGAG